ncbi:hypothetical protein FM120_15005 [Sphingobacterium faecium PCAi_F2.5]|nr:conserved hypothetical protein [Sphingobacterium sp. PM2-P1-29]SJN43749.1 hypothetical protein FM120_15005 [Sphingobacterium faecium PCAi_F2.5]
MIDNTWNNMKIILIVLLGLIALIMIYLGFRSDLLPPILTGVGFFIIATLFIIGVKK